jgi:amino acid adenylation domain-containing protein
MLEDTRAPVLLTQKHLLAEIEPCPARVICLDEDWGEIARESVERPASKAGPLNLSYVIYTSGSTGTPKGIAIAHRGIVNNIVDLNGRFGVGPEDRMLALSSLSFDMCVYEVFGALEAGGAIVMPEPAVLREPAQWAELIRRHRVTVWNSAPALLKMLVDYVEDRPELWPRYLRLAILGGDWVPVTLPDRLKALAPGVRFIVLGGATEASIHSIIYPVEKTEPTWKSIPYGRPQYNQKAYILNARLEPVPIGVPGELHLGGIGLGRGYISRPDQTAERFLPNPFAAEPGERIYKTGDLARWLPDGNIELIGRLDYQVKLRGLRIECGEIEALIRRHPNVRDAVVVAQSDGLGDKRLVAYLRADKTTPFQGGQLSELDGKRTFQDLNRQDLPNGEPLKTGEVGECLRADLRSLLRSKLPDYMIPSAFVFVTDLPLSPNGKVDRKALSTRQVETAPAQRAFVAPRTPDEEVLAHIYATTLGLERVGTQESFFELGGHSLLAAQVISQVRQAFQVELPLRALFEAPTVAGLAEGIRTVQWAKPYAHDLALAPVPREGRLPLSFAQQALWFIDQLLPGTSSYSIPIAVSVLGDLDLAALERALTEIVRRHEALRTVFPLVEGEPAQQIQGPESFHITHLDLGSLAEERRNAEVERLTASEARRPFDLARGPLIRATLVRLGDKERLLLVTMHHIVSDGWSLGVFSSELATLYDALAAGQPSPLPNLPIQYADYAAWQRRWLQGKVLEEQGSYWKRQLLSAPPKLEIPADYARPPVQTLRGTRHFFDLPSTLAEAARALSRKEGTTLFMTLLAAFKTLLHSYTDQEDLVVGSPFANRTRIETQGLIGAFVNTVVLRTSLSGDPTFRHLLGRVREVVLAASAHQELPFEKVVEQVRPPRDPSRNPLFQVNFRVLTAPPLQLTLRGLTLNSRIIDCTNSKFDLALELWALPDSFRGFFEYSTDLFEKDTIARMVGVLERLLGEVLTQPDIRLNDLNIVKEIRARRAPLCTSPQRRGEIQRRATSLKGVRRKAVGL